MKIIEGRGQVISLADAARGILEECRMLLPGVQALFGFQLIAVFSSGFGIELTEAEKRLHLAAIVLVAVSAALIMAPAAYHRQTGAERMDRGFIVMATRCLLASMPPLALGIGLDTYLVARVVLGSVVGAGSVAIALLLSVAWLWFVVPRWSTLRMLFLRVPVPEANAREPRN